MHLLQDLPRFNSMFTNTDKEEGMGGGWSRHALVGGCHALVGGAGAGKETEIGIFGGTQRAYERERLRKHCERGGGEGTRGGKKGVRGAHLTGWTSGVRKCIMPK
jgi:hypothetical protein